MGLSQFCPEISQNVVFTHTCCTPETLKKDQVPYLFIPEQIRASVKTKQHEF